MSALNFQPHASLLMVIKIFQIGIYLIVENSMIDTTIDLCGKPRAPIDPIEQVSFAIFV